MRTVVIVGRGEEGEFFVKNKAVILVIKYKPWTEKLITLLSNGSWLAMLRGDSISDQVNQRTDQNNYC